MTVFLDTSVLVAALLAKHADYERSFAVLDAVQNGRDQGLISAHSLAETYSILTKIPSPLRLSPEQALLSIEENILQYLETVSLSGRDYAALLREAAALGI